jgi:hypothetical protein
MEICDFRKRLPKDFNLYFPSDWHEGTEAFYENGAKKEIDIIKKDKIGFWVFGGDACESITTDDKRYNPAEHQGKYAKIMEQVEHVAYLMRDAKDKCLAIMQGNHEFKLSTRNIVDVDKSIAKSLGQHVRAPGFTMIAKLPGFKLFFTHGGRNTNHTAGDRQQRENNEAIWVKKYLRDLQGDCLVMGTGHGHKQRIRKPLYELNIIEKDGEEKQTYPTMMKSEDGVIHEDMRWYFMTGALRKLRCEGITTYSEMAGFRPSELGMIKLIVKDNMPVDCVKVIV